MQQGGRMRPDAGILQVRRLENMNIILEDMTADSIEGRVVMRIDK